MKTNVKQSIKPDTRQMMPKNVKPSCKTNMEEFRGKYIQRIVKLSTRTQERAEDEKTYKDKYEDKCETKRMTTDAKEWDTKYKVKINVLETEKQILKTKKRLETRIQNQICNTQKNRIKKNRSKDKRK